jgi:tryptophan-rich sensory protein
MDSALLCAVMVRYASQARRVDQTAAALAVPEIAWTAFATILSAAVARKNGLRASPGRTDYGHGAVRRLTFARS